MSEARADLLIVDDTPANLNVLSAILGKQGYRVRPAINGELALKAAQKAPPDLILLDIQMPGLDGYAVCRQLKANPQTAAIPVIFISALEDALDKVEAFAAGGVDYITKPFQIEEVLARVENQLALRRQGRALEELERYRDQVRATLSTNVLPTLAAFAADDTLPESTRSAAEQLAATLNNLV